MERILSISLDHREKSKEILMAIEQIRTQYFKMLKAVDKHSFLLRNQNIKYELLEIEEMLIKAGFIEPQDFKKDDETKSFTERMDSAAKVFYEFMGEYNPGILSP
jgi:hypothetical protein